MPVIAIIRNFEDYNEALLVSEPYEASGGEMSETGIVYKSVAELSRLIESKQVSPVEVAEAYLSRIDKLDFKFNSYLTVCRQEVLEQALAAETAITKGEYLGPMHGIPVGVKDQLWTKDVLPVFSRFRSPRRCDSDCQLKKSRGLALGQDKHDRVRNHRVHSPIQHSP